jgi:hypothetical protein
MVTCKICNKQFNKITNTHLEGKHNINLEEYKRLFPNTVMTSEKTLKAMSSSVKGKTYVERYGLEVASKIIESRKISAKKQFEDVNQRLVRRTKSWKGYKDISGDFWRTLCKAGENKKLGFDLDIEYIWSIFEQQNGQCALSGLPIFLETSLGSLSKSGFQRRTASLDRIDSSKGYLRGNVQWVHKEINQMKSNRTEEDFIRLCEAVTLFQASKQEI